jgi:predicted AAA+ superfamily ATPase
VSDLYVPRIVDGLLDELLLSFPAISLAGPRAAGKTTTAVRRGGTVLRMDRAEVRQSVAASPDAMLAGLRSPVILDEWQEVPELLGAVKRSVDEDPSPGRYILTGSVRAELENQVWPGTGRLLQVPMYGMSPSLRIPAAARRRWFAGYVEQMITRDVPAVAPRRDPELLRRYLSVLAVNTAGIAAESTLWSAAGINAKTAQAYQALFQRMFVLDLVPGRPGARHGRARTRQGRHPVRPRHAGPPPRLIGIEVKAAATVTAADARYLAWLRDQTGDAFAAGIVLHTGPHAFPVSDRIVAAPVSTLWS